MHPFRDDRRSKSIEEREEEYQRVRERIFAHDVSSCFNCLLSTVLPSAERPLLSPRELAGKTEARVKSESQSRKQQCFGERTWLRVAVQTDGESACALRDRDMIWVTKRDSQYRKGC